MPFGAHRPSISRIWTGNGGALPLAGCFALNRNRGGRNYRGHISDLVTHKFTIIAQAQPGRNLTGLTRSLLLVSYAKDESEVQIPDCMNMTSTALRR